MAVRLMAATAARRRGCLVVKRLLRRPGTIVTEIAALAVLAVIGAVVPQSGVAGPAAADGLRETAPAVAALVERLGLDRVFCSWPFIVVTLIATASLAIVTWELLVRLRRDWPRRLAPAHFRNAPLVRTFMRPARGASDIVMRRGRLGLAGTPLFHLGLFLLVAAGLLRALFGAEAVADVVEGEQLEATPSAWAAQWPGAAGRTFTLAKPLRLLRVRPEYGAGGSLRALEAEVAVSGRRRVVAINRPLGRGSRRIWLDRRHGAAVLLEIERDGVVTRTAVLARRDELGATTGRAALAGRELRVRVARAGQVQARLLYGGLLRWVGALPVGRTVVLPGGTTLRLAGVGRWVRMRGGDDPFLPLAWAGVALLIAGVVLVFLVTPVDVAVLVRPAPEGELVTVALRPHRLPALFRAELDRIAGLEGWRRET